MTYKNPNSFYDDTFKQKILNQYIFMMMLIFVNGQNGIRGLGEEERKRGGEDVRVGGYEEWGK